MKRGSTLLIAMFLGGCSLAPNFEPPGTIYHQRNQAVLHDPFPGTGIAPSFEGARPLGYDAPLSEPTRIQSNPYANRGIRGF